MIRVGITGQAGFVGTHLYNTLGLFPDKFQRIQFKDNYFQNRLKLLTFVKNCDAIVHLAAMNRHNDQEVIYDTNVSLVKQLIEACVATESKPHILFSSSIQEQSDNSYGRSKKDGRELFEKWADTHEAQFSGSIIPNVFGPFGHPNYNSVVATFCHQLAHDQIPQIKEDNHIRLIYVANLVKHIMDQILKVNRLEVTGHIEEQFVPYDVEIQVSEMLGKLGLMKNIYFNKGEIPCLTDPFDRDLFNTFITYIDHKSFYPYQYQLNSDTRGTFVETMKLNSGGQVSFSTTFPGVTRGNHFHTRKAERFAVMKGKARIELRRIGTDEVFTFFLDENTPGFVDMPIWFTHNITNIGEEELFTLFWINEHYDPEDVDTYFEKV
jgi:UDP-2-acetamido-2,6-beta-L-arabino-hexul-4-ose reductase